MRSRITATVLLCLLVGALGWAMSPEAQASTEGLTVAQQPAEDPAAEGGEGDNPGGEGQGSEEAETGASEGETEEGTSEGEAGPPWTYQMARITLALLLIMAVGVAYLYYRLVTTRRRGAV